MPRTSCVGKRLLHHAECIQERLRHRDNQILPYVWTEIPGTAERRMIVSFSIKGHRTKQILQANIDYHGATMEVDVAIEEMSELTKELIKNRRGRQNVRQIAEEIAHVEIMLHQVKMIFDCDDLVAEQWCLTMERIADELVKAGALNDGGN